MGLTEPKVHVLAEVETAETEGSGPVASVCYYRKTSTAQVIDISCVQCLVGRFRTVRNGRETPVSPLVLAHDVPRDDLVEPAEEAKGKGVTWGEPQTIHYEVHSPERDKAEYVEAKDQNRGKSAREERREQDEIVVEVERPGEGITTTTYTPEAVQAESPSRDAQAEPGAEAPRSKKEKKKDKKDKAGERKATSEGAFREPDYFPTEDETPPVPSTGEDTPIFESHSPEVEPVVITSDSELHRRSGVYQNPDPTSICFTEPSQRRTGSEAAAAAPAASAKANTRNWHELLKTQRR